MRYLRTSTVCLITVVPWQQLGSLRLFSLYICLRYNFNIFARPSCSGALPCFDLKYGKTLRFLSMGWPSPYLFLFCTLQLRIVMLLPSESHTYTLCEHVVRHLMSINPWLRYQLRRTISISSLHINFLPLACSLTFVELTPALLSHVWCNCFLFYA